MFVAGMTGCNHLFDQEPRGLPKGSIDREARATILLSRRSTANAQCLAGKHLLPNCPNRLTFPADLAVDVFWRGMQDVKQWYATTYETPRKSKGP